ncbi:hypothetical protein V6N11_012401 [Hibiscus sabdariffa]|uniref:RNase H type-1 domain-containing protein n=1 Tax=Hibiscus sabdariffa TaxID=183260 RepID=A0ABR2QB17_9ROSI
MAADEQSSSTPRPTPLSWIPPEPGWVCLSVDGAVSQPSSKGNIGGLIRDDNGVWLTGFAKATGHSSSLQAELWAILEVRAIDRFCHLNWLTEIVWVPRDQNRPADALAKLVDSSTITLCNFREPPIEVMSLLDTDRTHL